MAAATPSVTSGATALPVWWQGFLAGTLEQTVIPTKYGQQGPPQAPLGGSI